MEHLELGAAIGRYALIEHLATGRVAEVYLAERLGSGARQKRVILNTLRRDVIEDDAVVDVFLEEARTAGGLNHPNIATVFEADEHRGTAFIITEYVAGPSLASLITVSERSGRRDMLGFARIIAGAARGLHHAHTATTGRADLVHRDVSPERIRVSQDGIAKVVDFGAARAQDEGQKTGANVATGRLRYMAPEQLANAAHLDGRADVYALGVCLYACLTGTSPFPQASTPALLQARRRNHYVPLDEAAPGLPAALVDVIESAMAKDPSDRFGSAREVADALEAWVRGQDPSYDDARVGAWVRSLYPADAPWVARSRPSDPHRGAGRHAARRDQAERDETPHRTPGRPERRRAIAEPAAARGVEGLPSLRALAGAALLGVVVVVAGGWAWGAAIERDSRASARLEGPADASRAKSFIDEAERAEEAGNLGLADRLVEDAMASPALAPMEAVRAATLDDRIHRAQQLAFARAALARGEPSVAGDQVRDVLFRDPTNAEATALAAEIPGFAYGTTRRE